MSRRGEWHCALLVAPPRERRLKKVHLYINSGRWYLSHVPSTFATVSTHANVVFVFLPGGISKEWRHIVSANCDFERNLPCQYRVFTDLSGNTWGDQKYTLILVFTLLTISISGPDPPMARNTAALLYIESGRTALCQMWTLHKPELLFSWEVDYASG